MPRGSKAQRLAWGVFTLALAGAARLGAQEMAPLPRPHGWLGTTEQWAQGLGIAIALAELLLLLVLWRGTREDFSSTIKLWLVAGIVAFPLVIVFFSYAHGMAASQTVTACAQCHVMKPYVADLRDPRSETLAAVHYKNRYIQENHCYQCHSDYGMSGTIRAKFEGLGHIVRYTTASYSLPIKIAHPYPNVRCLECHGESQRFLKNDGHPSDQLPKFLSGELSCLECHGPAHPTWNKQ